LLTFDLIAANRFKAKEKINHS